MPAADFKHFDVSKILASVAQQTSQGTLKEVYTTAIVALS
jgi:hypothetical protein